MNSIQTATPLLSRTEAAAFLGLRPQTLAKWKTTGAYRLRCVKVGRLAKYLLSDLEKFIADRATEGAGQPRAE